MNRFVTNIGASVQVDEGEEELELTRKSLHEMNIKTNDENWIRYGLGNESGIVMEYMIDSDDGIENFNKVFKIDEGTPSYAELNAGEKDETTKRKLHQLEDRFAFIFRSISWRSQDDYRSWFTNQVKMLSGDEEFTSGSIIIGAFSEYFSSKIKEISGEELNHILLRFFRKADHQAFILDNLLSGEPLMRDLGMLLEKERNSIRDLESLLSRKDNVGMLYFDNETGVVRLKGNGFTSERTVALQNNFIANNIRTEDFIEQTHSSRFIRRIGFHPIHAIRSKVIKDLTIGAFFNEYESAEMQAEKLEEKISKVFVSNTGDFFLSKLDGFTYILECDDIVKNARHFPKIPRNMKIGENTGALTRVGNEFKLNASWRDFFSNCKITKEGMVAPLEKLNPEDEIRISFKNKKYEFIGRTPLTWNLIGAPLGLIREALSIGMSSGVSPFSCITKDHVIVLDGLTFNEVIEDYREKLEISRFKSEKIDVIFNTNGRIFPGVRDPQIQREKLALALVIKNKDNFDPGVLVLIIDAADVSHIEKHYEVRNLPDTTSYFKNIEEETTDLEGTFENLSLVFPDEKRLQIVEIMNEDRTSQTTSISPIFSSPLPIEKKGANISNDLLTQHFYNRSNRLKVLHWWMINTFINLIKESGEVDSGVQHYSSIEKPFFSSNQREINAILLSMEKHSKETIREIITDAFLSYEELKEIIKDYTFRRDIVTFLNKFYEDFVLWEHFIQYKSTDEEWMLLCTDLVSFHAESHSKSIRWIMDVIRFFQKGFVSLLSSYAKNMEDLITSLDGFPLYTFPMSVFPWQYSAKIISDAFYTLELHFTYIKYDFLKPHLENIRNIEYATMELMKLIGLFIGFYKQKTIKMPVGVPDGYVRRYFAHFLSQYSSQEMLDFCLKNYLKYSLDLWYPNIYICTEMLKNKQMRDVLLEQTKEEEHAVKSFGGKYADADEDLEEDILQKPAQPQKPDQPQVVEELEQETSKSRKEKSKPLEKEKPKGKTKKKPQKEGKEVPKLEDYSLLQFTGQQEKKLDVFFTILQPSSFFDNFSKIYKGFYHDVENANRFEMAKILDPFMDELEFNTCIYNGLKRFFEISAVDQESVVFVEIGVSNALMLSSIASLFKFKKCIGLVKDELKEANEKIYKYLQKLRDQTNPPEFLGNKAIDLSLFHNKEKGYVVFSSNDPMEVFEKSGVFQATFGLQPNDPLIVFVNGFSFDETTDVKKDSMWKLIQKIAGDDEVGSIITMGKPQTVAGFFRKNDFNVGNCSVPSLPGPNVAKKNQSITFFFRNTYKTKLDKALINPKRSAKIKIDNLNKALQESKELKHLARGKKLRLENEAVVEELFVEESREGRFDLIKYVMNEGIQREEGRELVERIEEADVYTELSQDFWDKAKREMMHLIIDPKAKERLPESIKQLQHGPPTKEPSSKKKRKVEAAEKESPEKRREPEKPQRKETPKETSKRKPEQPTVVSKYLQPVTKESRRALPSSTSEVQMIQEEEEQKSLSQKPQHSSEVEGPDEGLNQYIDQLIDHIFLNRKKNVITKTIVTIGTCNRYFGALFLLFRGIVTRAESMKLNVALLVDYGAVDTRTIKEERVVDIDSPLYVYQYMKKLMNINTIITVDTFTRNSELYTRKGDTVYIFVGSIFDVMHIDFSSDEDTGKLLFSTFSMNPETNSIMTVGKRLGDYNKTRNILLIPGKPNTQEVIFYDDNTKQRAIKKRVFKYPFILAVNTRERLGAEISIDGYIFWINTGEKKARFTFFDKSGLEVLKPLAIDRTVLYDLWRFPEITIDDYFRPKNPLILSTFSKEEIKKVDNAQVESTRYSYEKRDEEVKRLREENRRKEETIKKKEETIKKLTRELEGRKEALENVMEDKTKQEKQLKKFQSERNELEKKIKDLEKKSHGKEDMKSKMNQNVQELQKQLQQKEREWEITKSEKKNAELQLEKAKRQEEELLRDYNRALDKNQELEEERRKWIFSSPEPNKKLEELIETQKKEILELEKNWLNANQAAFKWGGIAHEHAQGTIEAKRNYETVQQELIKLKKDYKINSKIWSEEKALLNQELDELWERNQKLQFFISDLESRDVSLTHNELSKALNEIEQTRSREQINKFLEEWKLLNVFEMHEEIHEDMPQELQSLPPQSLSQQPESYIPPQEEHGAEEVIAVTPSLPPEEEVVEHRFQLLPKTPEEELVERRERYLREQKKVELKKKREKEREEALKLTIPKRVYPTQLQEPPPRMAQSKKESESFVEDVELELHQTVIVEDITEKGETPPQTPPPPSGLFQRMFRYLGLSRSAVEEIVQEKKKQETAPSPPPEEQLHATKKFKTEAVNTPQFSPSRATMVITLLETLPKFARDIIGLEEAKRNEFGNAGRESLLTSVMTYIGMTLQKIMEEAGLYDKGYTMTGILWRISHPFTQFITDPIEMITGWRLKHIKTFVMLYFSVFFRIYLIDKEIVGTSPGVIEDIFLELKGRFESEKTKRPKNPYLGTYVSTSAYKKAYDNLDGIWFFREMASTKIGWYEPAKEGLTYVEALFHEATEGEETLYNLTKQMFLGLEYDIRSAYNSLSSIKPRAPWLITANQITWSISDTLDKYSQNLLKESLETRKSGGITDQNYKKLLSIFETWARYDKVTITYVLGFLLYYLRRKGKMKAVDLITYLGKDIIEKSGAKIDPGEEIRNDPLQVDLTEEQSPKGKEGKMEKEEYEVPLLKKQTTTPSVFSNPAPKAANLNLNPRPSAIDVDAPSKEKDLGDDPQLAKFVSNTLKLDIPDVIKEVGFFKVKETKEVNTDIKTFIYRMKLQSTRNANYIVSVLVTRDKNSGRFKITFSEHWGTPNELELEFLNTLRERLEKDFNSFGK